MLRGISIFTILIQKASDVKKIKFINDFVFFNLIWQKLLLKVGAKAESCKKMSTKEKVFSRKLL